LSPRYQSRRESRKPRDASCLSSASFFPSFLVSTFLQPLAAATSTLDLEHVPCNNAAFAMEETDVPRLVQPRACARTHACARARARWSIEMHLGTERSERAGETGSKVEAINPPARARAGLFRKAKDDKGRLASCTLESRRTRGLVLFPAAASRNDYV